MTKTEPKKFYKKMSFHVFVFKAILIFIFLALYCQGYFSSSSKVEVKSPNEAVSYQNNMQKTMDHLKELLLGATTKLKKQGKIINVLKKKSRKLPINLLWLLLLILLSLRGEWNSAKIGYTVISEFLTKIQASIARQEESTEALKIYLKVL